MSSLVIVTLLTGSHGAAAISGDPTPAPTVTVAAGPGEMDADVVTFDTAGRSVSSASTTLSEGWATEVALLPGTQMVALSWDGDRSGPAGPASARLAVQAHADGRAQGWTEVAPDPDDQGGEGAGRVGSEILWLGAEGADRLEIRIDAGPIVGLELLRMRHHPDETVVEPRATAGKTSQPTIRPRSDWTSRGWASGNSGCGNGPSVASRLDHAVIHHTASTNSYTAAQVPGLIEGIRLYHTSSLGWCDIAYNFVVDRFGGIWQGRAGDISQPVIGGHAKGFNTNSVGVTLLGQFEPGASPASAAPTTAMMDSTARLLAWKLRLHGLSPTGTTTVVSGGSTRYAAGVSVTLPIINSHQETSTTACPGANVISQMGALRTATAALTGSNPPPPPPPPTDTRWLPFTTVESYVYRQYVDFLRHPGTYDARLWWHQALTSGTSHRNALPASLLASSELQSRSAPSVRLYFAYFDRAPDHDGLRFWWDRMDRGDGIRNVSAAFARSPEFTSRYGSLTNAQFVSLVYRNVLGRAPDAEGNSFWVQRLASNKESRGGLMVLFSESGEYKAKKKAATEAVITHDVMLGRALTTSSLALWEAMVKADPVALLNHIFASPEYANRVG